jgi:membrane protease YdiL (CAAX protease family)
VEMRARGRAADSAPAIAAVAYCLAYLAYLFTHIENEVGHWRSIVLLPLLLIYAAQAWQGDRRFAPALASVGLRRGNLRAGLLIALLAGLGLSALQLMISNRAAAIWDLLASGRAFYLFPLAFTFMLLGPAFTEEFFFRGVVQTRLTRWFGWHRTAILVTSALFGLYHVPYAYLNPRWPSHGDLPAAFTAAMFQGGIGGLILGTIYAVSRQNLLALMLTHALLNALPGMTAIKFGSGG